MPPTSEIATIWAVGGPQLLNPRPDACPLFQQEQRETVASRVGIDRRSALPRPDGRSPGRLVRGYSPCRPYRSANAISSILLSRSAARRKFVSGEYPSFVEISWIGLEPAMNGGAMLHRRRPSYASGTDVPGIGKTTEIGGLGATSKLPIFVCSRFGEFLELHRNCGLSPPIVGRVRKR